MTDHTERLAEIEARAAAATPGPWESEQVMPARWAVGMDHIGESHGAMLHTDAEFIAHSREDVPRLVDALTAGRQALIDNHPKCTDACEMCAELDQWLHAYDDAVARALGGVR